MRGSDGCRGASQIHHLVVVAGPSGVGKSTLLHRIAQGDIPSELSSILPPGIAGWPQILACDVSDDHVPSPRGLVLHYNVARRTVSKGFANDPPLRLIDRAARLTVVNLVASESRVAVQLACRDIRDGLKRTPLRPRCLIVACAAVLLGTVAGEYRRTGLLRRIFGALARCAGLSAQSEQSLRWYWRPGWLAACHAEWCSFISEAAPPDTVIVDLEPDRAELFADFEWRIRRRRAGAASPRRRYAAGRRGPIAPAGLRT